MDQGDEDMDQEINILEETDTVAEAAYANVIQQDLNAVPLDDHDYDGIDRDME